MSYERTYWSIINMGLSESDCPLFGKNEDGEKIIIEHFKSQEHGNYFRHTTFQKGRKWVTIVEDYEDGTTVESYERLDHSDSWLKRQEEAEARARIAA